MNFSISELMLHYLIRQSSLTAILAIDFMIFERLLIPGAASVTIYAKDGNIMKSIV